ncbi:MAG: hypothetical protein UU95_C0013G0006 [Parcubacteria group bacterium GW2011_GWC2_42_12]|uniref:Response regulatory domain-containing protein n=1 Tax=Candidatus Falkowbacteria bacterium RIFCSPHIGHO2_02_FULL_42_9 TaxID=1797986 RepID=A0A1F5S8X4_9BACT|nr:MAG: hypothetical protein UU95_C0013G0006 [Parcubacteria group bacterium GW2011_GWC2_42_12]OGF23164.1 MAG: hypothetical protein A3D45_00275 [Candidatus Falkowbacteria bacterium RIFCSPHIGHO2_02_FULL_42_9]
MQCLVISHNGDGDQLPAMLIELGLIPVTSGTGREGVEAIEHYKPDVMILLYHSGSSQDVVALRAIQVLCRQAQSSPLAVVISDKGQIPVVRNLLGPKKHYAGKVNLLACPPVGHRTKPLAEQLQVLSGKLKPVLHALLNQHQRQPVMTA